MSFLNIKKKEKKKNRLIFSPGNYTWTVPDNVNEVEVHVWGGGGNGRSSSSTNPVLVGTGGGGGGYVRHLYRVTGGNILQIAVGGQGGTSSVSCPSNPFPQPISATGGADGTQSSGNTAPIVGSVVNGGSGGSGSFADVPLELRVNGITMAASGGNGGGVRFPQDFAPTAPVLSLGPTAPQIPRALQPTLSPFGPQVYSDYIGAAGGAAGSHLGNGGSGAPTVGYTQPSPTVLSECRDTISLQDFPAPIYLPSSVFWSIGGAGIGGQNSVGPAPNIQNLGSSPTTQPTEKTWYSHYFRGASAEYPDSCPKAIMGTRNRAEYDANSSDVTDLATSISTPTGPISASREKYGVINEKWFYVEEMVGSNGCEISQPGFSPLRRPEPSFRAGCGQNGYIEPVQVFPTPVPVAPFLGGGCGGKYLERQVFNGFPSFEPLWGTDWIGRGGSGTIGGGGGGQALGQPGDNGVGGVGCVIIYW